jgi:hypothetical protein
LVVVWAEPAGTGQGDDAVQRAPGDLGQLNMDPDQPVPFQSHGAFLSGFPAAAIDALAGLADALAPCHASYDYYNSEETPAPASAVLPPASHRRLQKIKAVYDPDQAIISAHPVSPTRP